MKIYKVRLAIGRITKNDFTLEEIECEEKGKTYKTISNQMIKKSAFMVVDSIYQQGLCHHQSYFMFCYKDRISEAKAILYNHVKGNLEKLKTDLDASIKILAEIKIS